MPSFARRTAEIVSIFCLLPWCSPSRTAFAQSAQAPARPELSPPELLERVEAAYPADAWEQRLEATVGLRLTIDIEGRVSAVEVIERAGHGFDEAARQAALGFRFAPARRGAQPVQARVRYPFVFSLPAAAAPTAPTVPAEPAAPAPAPAVAPPSVARGTSPSSAPVAPESVTDVQVLGKLSEGERLQQSAEAVNVIDVKKARQQSADMGEVLARTQGVAVRRDGGLGSTARFALNGLYDEQIRFFLDGVPLDISGYPSGIENVPVNLVERIEVFRGVVPVRFGADALGGAVNLVSDRSNHNRLLASYQVGAFGTHRLTLDARYVHPRSALFAGVSGFFDRAKNNYPVDVEVPDARGRLSDATVKRFHDGYTAGGGSVELGVADKRWAKRLSVRGYLSAYDKELQNNLVMTVPYGAVHYGEQVWGVTARYEVDPKPNWNIELIASYGHRTIDFVDDSDWVYDWFGRRIRERRIAGEIESNPTDQTVWQKSGFGRATVAWQIAPGHTVRISSSPVYTTRTGADHLLSAVATRDPLTAQRDLFTVVSGLEYESTFFAERLSNMVFVKDYVYRANAEDPLPGGVFRQRDTDSHTQGFGDSLRYRFTPWLLAKASYEFATRLPRADEVFGNGVLILANLELSPEVSHNANLGPRLELKRTGYGDFVLDINAFLRDSDRLIVLLGNDRFYAYQNVYHARGMGLENAASWTSPGRYLSLDGTLTWQDVRNASSNGTFGDFEGDRIPNRPWLFASWAARLRFANLPGPDDTVEPYYYGRYVHEFYRGWESQGLRAFKQVVDSQVTHNVGVSWTVNSEVARVTSTLEVANVTDAKVFDNFGVQRPGRAVYLKLSGGFQ